MKVIHTLMPFFILVAFPPSPLALLVSVLHVSFLKRDTEPVVLGELRGGVQYAPLRHFAQRGGTQRFLFSCLQSSALQLQCLCRADSRQVTRPVKKKKKKAFPENAFVSVRRRGFAVWICRVCAGLEL